MSKQKPKARVHSLEFKIKVLDEIASGTLSYRAAMDKYNLASSVVHGWRVKREAGKLKATPRVGAWNAGPTKTAPNRGSFTALQKQQALEELANGGNAKEIAKRLGVTDAAIYYWRAQERGGYPSQAKRKSNGKANGTAAVVVSEPAHVPQIAASNAMRDATIFLRRAKAELMTGIRAGTIDDLDPAHLLSLLALRSLQGA